MRSSIGRVLLMVFGGFAVVAISFFATMQVLDYWLTPPDPNASVIHVVDATYGLACKDFVPPPGHANQVKVGNTTAALTSACDKAKTTCLFAVDAVQIGDPADGCARTSSPIGAAAATRRSISSICRRKRAADRRCSAVRRRRLLIRSN